MRTRVLALVTVASLLVVAVGPAAAAQPDPTLTITGEVGWERPWRWWPDGPYDSETITVDVSVDDALVATGTVTDVAIDTANGDLLWHGEISVDAWCPIVTAGGHRGVIVAGPLTAHTNQTPYVPLPYGALLIVDLPSRDLVRGGLWTIQGFGDVTSGADFCTDPVATIFTSVLARMHRGNLLVDDLAPPWWPVGSSMQASQVDHDSLRLTWTPAEDNLWVYRYRVYRNDQPYTSSSYLSAWVGGLQPDTEYTFEVRACDQAGNCSPDGLTTTVTTLGAEHAVEDLADLIHRIGLDPGTEASLSASLDVALALLTDDNDLNDHAAVAVLETFINKVEARTPNKIDTWLAQRLIATVEQIIGWLTA